LEAGADADGRVDVNTLAAEAPLESRTPLRYTCCKMGALDQPIASMISSRPIDASWYEAHAAEAMSSDVASSSTALCSVDALPGDVNNPVSDGLLIYLLFNLG